MSSGVILAPEMSSTSIQVKGTGKDIPITVYITNQSNNLRARIGQYNFDFSTASYTANWEDFYSAINDIDGFHKETEPPTEAESNPPAPEPTTAPSATEPPIDYNDYNGDGRPDDMRDLDHDGIPDSWGWIDENGNGIHDWLE